ncbi:FimV/HubP family polar landmark protein [Polynucleobacter sp. MWH-Svant-W18]|uniref:FimV/HubP family polar landmark protein n=1 Tax=Polynucleobacter sp. MWH-Svant-W18 TaxID=1855909 RepID=UPI001BFE57A3|nr:FimV/HubP family polar landmark protein [Polynucleobacter sp. MWH-Svant-W18]QWD78659.1 pilus assembly protein FimV [Polynucleobacter sp. MWH-Svant-W18]
MLRTCQLSFVKALCFIWLSWSCAAWAISLGSPQLQSKTGEPLRVEIPIRVAADEESALNSLKAQTPNKAAYERLGISSKILELNPQVSVYRNRQEKLMILVETVNPVPLSEDPFVDVLVNLNWASGSITKTYTLLLGDVQKVLVKPGQTLSEIAALMAPQLDGATLDQAMMALYKANPDAFASGSINRLAAGAELNKPSQALLRSISPAEANQFVAEANAQWRAEQGAAGANPDSKSGSTKVAELTPKDRLKIGSSADSNEERRYTEELVAQEKQLEQAKARVAELEKNVADLQRLLDKSKEKKAVDDHFGLGAAGPAILAITLITLTGLLLWGFARNARRSELGDFQAASMPADTHHKLTHANYEMPERAKALFAGIDLDLSKPAVDLPSTPPAPILNPLADTLRVKLNLARAYITIEDFSAARRSLEEVLQVSNAVDPTITIEAQGLLAELSHRNA